ncbi:18S rRNA maturation protein [Myotisia sp. PD_48]|nr:18S rRNA maturation protein [Myotisia sp. PD_48]
MGSRPDKRHHHDDASPQDSSKRPRYTYTKQESKRDDRAYAAGKLAIKPRNSKSNEPPASGQSVNELKSKIRATKRVLEHSKTLPAGVRVEKERALKGYQRDLEKVEEKKVRSAMIKKYHFVRFLERKSATQALKKLLRAKSRLDPADDSNIDNTQSNPQSGSISSSERAKQLSELDERIHVAKVDINYAIYSPLTEKYISLYPNDQDKKRGKMSNKNSHHGSEQDEDGVKSEQRIDLETSPDQSVPQQIIRTRAGEKPPMWYVVQKCMEENTLELLRDGKLGIGLNGEKKPEKVKGCEEMSALPVIQKGGANSTKIAIGVDTDDQDGGIPLGNDDGERESDDGFFDI